MRHSSRRPHCLYPNISLHQRDDGSPSPHERSSSCRFLQWLGRERVFCFFPFLNLSVGSALRCDRLLLFNFLISYVIYFFSRRNRSPPCHFHRYYRCQFGDITFWLTADTSWNSARSLHRSVTLGRHQPIARLTSITPGGFFSGNTAVIYSVLGEITDSTNQAIALPIFAVAWPVGSVIG